MYTLYFYGSPVYKNPNFQLQKNALNKKNYSGMLNLQFVWKVDFDS